MHADFTASKVQNIMKTHGIKWKTGCQYAPMSSGKPKGMVVTKNLTIEQTALKNGMHWSELVKHVVYEYCQRFVGDGHSPFHLMYGMQPLIYGLEDKLLLTGQPKMYSKLLETLAAHLQRAQNSMEKKDHVCNTSKIVRYMAGSMVWVAKESLWEL